MENKQIQVIKELIKQHEMKIQLEQCAINTLEDLLLKYTE
jgi:hypothetical protein